MLGLGLPGPLNPADFGISSSTFSFPNMSFTSKDMMIPSAPDISNFMTGGMGPLSGGGLNLNMQMPEMPPYEYFQQVQSMQQANTQEQTEFSDLFKADLAHKVDKVFESFHYEFQGDNPVLDGNGKPKLFEGAESEQQRTSRTGWEADIKADLKQEQNAEQAKLDAQMSAAMQELKDNPSMVNDPAKLDAWQAKIASLDAQSSELQIAGDQRVMEAIYGHLPDPETITYTQRSVLVDQTYDLSVENPDGTAAILPYETHYSLTDLPSSTTTTGTTGDPGAYTADWVNTIPYDQMTTAEKLYSKYPDRYPDPHAPASTTTTTTTDYSQMTTAEKLYAKYPDLYNPDGTLKTGATAPADGTVDLSTIPYNQLTTEQKLYLKYPDRYNPDGTLKPVATTTSTTGTTSTGLPDPDPMPTQTGDVTDGSTTSTTAPAPAPQVITTTIIETHNTTAVYEQRTFADLTGSSSLLGYIDGKFDDFRAMKTAGDQEVANSTAGKAIAKYQTDMKAFSAAQMASITNTGVSLDQLMDPNNYYNMGDLSSDPTLNANMPQFDLKAEYAKLGVDVSSMDDSMFDSGNWMSFGIPS